MNYSMIRLIGITIFLWLCVPLGATAAEVAAGTGENVPAAGTDVGTPAAAGTVANATAGTREGATSAASASGTSPTAAGDGDKRAKVEIGARTSEWLDAQREGRLAGNLLPILGAEAGPSYRRYIDTFTKPVPDQMGYSASTTSTAK